MVTDFWQDLRYGARTLVKNSAFTLVSHAGRRYRREYRCIKRRQRSCCSNTIRNSPSCCCVTTVITGS
jgi:hypothetical protein